MRIYIPRLCERHAHVRLALAIGIGGCVGSMLASCSKYELVDAPSGLAHIPLPKRALLEPLPEPGCTTEE